MRNRSFTKEEIEAYWRSKQKTVEEHLKEISTLSETNQQVCVRVCMWVGVFGQQLADLLRILFSFFFFLIFFFIF